MQMDVSLMPLTDVMKIGFYGLTLGVILGFIVWGFGFVFKSIVRLIKRAA